MEDKSKIALKTIKDIVKKDTKPMEDKNLSPGQLVMFTYDAKDKTKKYDRTPLVLVLRRSKSYVLGINFHWTPIGLRKKFLAAILRTQKKKDLEKGIINIDYQKVKPLLFILRIYPVLRLYIRKRISKRGINIPFEKWKEVVELRTETFTNGQESENSLYRKAVFDLSKRKKKKTKKR